VVQPALLYLIERRGKYSPKKEEWVKHIEDPFVEMDIFFLGITYWPKN